MPAFWVGIDSGKRAHHCVVIDQSGAVLLSRRVDNDENDLLELIATIADMAASGEVCWATDLNAGGAALLIGLLAAHGQRLLYIPGRIVHHAAATYRGDGKTGAKAGSSPTRRGCAQTSSQSAARTRSAWTCGC